MHNLFSVNRTKKVFKPAFFFAKAVTLAFVICMVFTAVGPLTVYAESESSNPDTGYKVVVDDEADLLTDAEERILTENMMPITAYGNVALKTIDFNYTSTSNYASSYYNSLFGRDSGTVFLIDMDNREIYIYSDGAIYKSITRSYAYTITDNVYTYATDGDYFTCAFQAYEQIYKVLDGQRIAKPMKYISNAFLAVIIALLINYFLVKKLSGAQKATDKQLLEGIASYCNLMDAQAHYSHQTRTYSPRQKSSSGGGGGGHGGGGGGGGHSF